MSNAININQVERHLDILDGRAGDVNLYRHIMSKPEGSGKVTRKSYSVASGYSDLVKELDENQHQYVTVGLFSSPKSRTKETIRATSGLYVDLDDSLFRGDGRIWLELIKDSLTKARIPEPSLTIHSGGGWHLYWIFKDLYYFNTDEDVQRYEEVIKSIISSLAIIGADPKSSDVVRMLRLSGTINKKPEYREGTRVAIIESYDVQYNIEDFNGLHVVRTLPESYHQSSKKEAIKYTLTAKDEPTAIKQSSNKPRVINQSLTRPEEDFPLHLVGEIIIDAQVELERRSPQARFMEEVNRSVMVDLLLNYVRLPRNTYVFEDGSAGQYVQVGSRNHYLWMLARRGVTEKHLSIINKTLLLPSLNHSEFINVLKVGRELKVPKIEAMVSNLGLTLSEQSTMVVLKINYGADLDEIEKFINKRTNQLITEAHRQYILANPNKPAKVVAEELVISVSSVYQVRQQKGGEVMSREDRWKEVREMTIDIDRTGRVALEEVYDHYIRAGQEIDSIIHKQGLIHSLRVQLTDEQKEDLMFLADSLITKIEIVVDQLESYEEFIRDDSEFFKSGKIKKTVLLDKINKLKSSTGRLVTA